MNMATSRRSSPEQSGTLFPFTSEFRIVKLGSEDARKLTDNLRVLKGLIDASEDMYPSIGRWFSTKVVPGLRSSQRAAWVGYEGQNAVAAAVLKTGERSKFCHVKIHRDLQDMDLGRLFFTMMTLEVRHLAKEIHFTLPESLWESKAKFFRSFGFSSVTKASRQYRNGDVELVCSAPLAIAQRSALARLPELIVKFNVGGYSMVGDILVSMKPKYADRILAGSKLVEVRKKFSGRWVGRRAVLYASSPQKALVGEATVRAVTSGSPTEIWARFGPNIGCSSGEFAEYVGGATKVSAIELDDVYPYREPVSVSQISHLLRQDLRPPQSYCDLRLDDPKGGWARAVSVASILHGRFSPRRCDSGLGDA